MSELENYSIAVSVESQYLELESDPNQEKYVFSYEVTIINEGNIPAKLLSRHWVITDSNGQEQQVKGEGVVGEQPRIKPGEGFRYSSGAVLETPVGAMQGSYQMVADDGVKFDAIIQPFSLANPKILN